MKVIETALPGVLVIEPQVFGDARGFFYESYNEARFRDAGIDARFVQSNVSRSAKGVLRGLHYQWPHPQGKFVSVLEGEVFDVAVDIRRSSPTYGKWIGERLSAQNRRMMWIPEGFAHGFLVLSDTAEFLYKTTDYYAPDQERTLLWNDPAVGVRWPLSGEPVLKPKDAAGTPLASAETFA